MNDIEHTKIVASIDALISLLNKEKIHGLNDNFEKTEEYLTAKKEIYRLYEYGIDIDYSTRTKAWLNRANNNQIYKYAYTMFYGQTDDSVIISDLRNSHKDHLLLNLYLKIKNPIQPAY